MSNQNVLGTRLELQVLVHACHGHVVFDFAEKTVANRFSFTVQHILVQISSLQRGDGFLAREG